MNHNEQAWQKLVTAARRFEDGRDTAAPYGFSTRVAAMAMASRTDGVGALLERFSWRALAVAGLLAVGGVATNYASSSSAADESLLDDTNVTVVFDIS